jgi:hypothetical protein
LGFEEWGEIDLIYEIDFIYEQEHMHTFAWFERATKIIAVLMQDGHLRRGKEGGPDETKHIWWPHDCHHQPHHKIKDPKNPNQRIDKQI